MLILPLAYRALLQAGDAAGGSALSCGASPADEVWLLAYFPRI